MDKELNKKLSTAKVLIVGVGGIGCEVLKYLSKYHLKEIHIVDMDIIELTNLNRQFYFRKQHIGKYKADTAKEVLAKIAPHLNIIAHNKSIMDFSFGVDFFAGFDCVLMALDSHQVRSHVNKMCCKTRVLVIESGTNGFSGQTYPIFPGVTKCYDCYPKIAPKTYQVCTIRMLPTEIIHCLVWAKTIFSNLFENLQSEGYNICSGIEKYFELDSSDPHKPFFDEIFMQTPSQLKATDEETFKAIRPLYLEWLNLDKETLTQKCNNEAVFGFIEDYTTLFKRLSETHKTAGGYGFDKDNDDHVSFITCIANLRAFIYGIESIDAQKARTMVGNIIPAISSTNSQIAGLMVFEMFKIFSKINNFKALTPNDVLRFKSNAIYVSNMNKIGALFCVLESQNPECGVCTHQYVVYRVDFNKELMDLKTLIKSSISSEFEVFYKNSLVLEVLNDENGSVHTDDSSVNMGADNQATEKMSIKDFFKVEEHQKEVEILVLFTTQDMESKLIITLVDSVTGLGCFEDMNVDNIIKMEKIYSTEITSFRDQKKLFKMKQDQQKIAHTFLNDKIATLSLDESDIEVCEGVGAKKLKKIKT